MRNALLLLGCLFCVAGSSVYSLEEETLVYQKLNVKNASQIASSQFNCGCCGGGKSRRTGHITRKLPRHHSSSSSDSSAS